MLTNENIKHLKPILADLRVGDTVYVLKSVRDVWTYFRYCILSKEEILRITPKRTKIETNKGIYDCRSSNPFILPDERLIEQHKVAQSFIKVCNARSEFSKQNIKDFSDEEILQLSEISEQLRSIFKKHNNN